MIVTIELENMEFKAYHGCYELEKKVGNRFLVSVVIDAEIGDAAERDDLLTTINYVNVYNVIKSEMEEISDTIENVAHRILRSIYSSFNQVVKTTVKVSKLAPPIGGKAEKVSVTISR